MRRRRLVLALGVGAFAAPLLVCAQPAPKVTRIGYLGAENNPVGRSFLDAFRAGLRDLGYVEGRNVVIELRWVEAKSERVAELVAEMIRLKVDVIVTEGTPLALAAKRATKTVPLVIPAAGDPVATGLVESLARPGGNLTGSAIFSSELMVKRFEMLVGVLPSARRIAVLLNPTNPVQRVSVEEMEKAAARSNVAIQRVEIRSPSEFEGAFASMAEQRLDAVAITQDGMFIRHAGVMATLAAKHRLPSIGISEFAEAGGLIG